VLHINCWTGPLLLRDPVALPLLGAQAAATVRCALGRHQSREGKALRAHVVLRSRFTEDRVEAAAAKGIRRYILIGAGFDSFALRRPPWAQALEIVEIDHPATQSAKRERIARAGLAEPDNLIFAPADFEHEGLGDVLTQCRSMPFHRPSVWLRRRIFSTICMKKGWLSCLDDPSEKGIVL
jgi:methyltransferase (TIGR00027 family)